MSRWVGGAVFRETKSTDAAGRGSGLRCGEGVEKGFSGGLRRGGRCGKSSLCFTPLKSTFFRYKSMLGGRLRARGFVAQETEVAISCKVLNRMLQLGRPKPVVVAR